VLDFHIEILPGAERVVFRGDLVVAHDDGEILDDFLAIEDADDLVFLGRGEEGFLVFAVFDLGAEVGGVDEDDVALVAGIEEEDGDVGAGGGEDVAGHGDHSGEHLVFHEVLAYAFFDPGLGGDEAGGHDDGGFPLLAQRGDDVLEEEQIDRHLVLGGWRDLGNPGEEALFVRGDIEFVAEVGEIQLEGRIGDDAVEHAQAAIFLAVIGMQDGIALDDVRDGVDELVQDEIEPQQAGGFLGNVLRIDAAFFLADGVGEIHQQGAGSGGGIVTGDVFLASSDQARGHDLGDGVGRVILGVFPAAVLVVVLDEVFEDGGEEVELLAEQALEAEVYQLVDEGAGEVVALGGDVFGNGLEERLLLAIVGHDGEDVLVQRGDGQQGGIQGFGEVFLVLLAVEGGEEVLGLEMGGALAELDEQHLVIRFFVFPQGVFP